MKWIPFSALVLALISSSCRQSNTRDVSIDYPGGRLSGDTAELFAQGIISTDTFEHSAPTFSPDGKTVLWSVVEMPSWKARRGVEEVGKLRKLGSWGVGEVEKLRKL